MRRFKILLATAMLAAPASGALADDGGPTSPGTPTAPTAAAPGPIRMIDRPFSLKEGGIAAYGSIDIAHFGSGMLDFSQYQMRIAGAYGISKDLSVGAEYGFPFAGDGTDKTTGRGPFNLYGLFSLTQDDSLTVAVYAAFQANLAGAFDAMSGDPTTTKAFLAGFDVRYNVTPDIAVFTGSPFGPAVPGTLAGLAIAGVPARGTQQHFSMSLEDNGAILFDVPVGVGVQATPDLFAYLDTTLASFAISNSPYKEMSGKTKSAVFFGGDDLELPLHLGAFYAFDKNIDLGGAVLTNLDSVGDLYVVSLAARWTNKSRWSSGQRAGNVGACFRAWARASW
jgi:hypothetical protein